MTTYEQSLCDYCPEQIHCRNLYVAFRILEEELRYADRPDLSQRFDSLKQTMTDYGYSYPSGSWLCSIKDKELDSSTFVQQAHSLLREIRKA